MSEAGVQITCARCLAGAKVFRRHGRMIHRVPEFLSWGGRVTPIPEYYPCPDWDSECRHVSEPMGWFTFAWWPVRCRNGKVRWLQSVEKMANGTFTLGNRAH